MSHYHRESGVGTSDPTTKSSFLRVREPSCESLPAAKRPSCPFVASIVLLIAESARSAFTVHMRELRADHPVILEDEDTHGAVRPFLAWRVELIHLGRGPVRRSRVVIPLGAASVALVHVQCATILRGLSSDSDVSLFSTSPASPLVRAGSRPVGGGVCLMLGPRAPFEIYLPKDCCAFILSIACTSAVDNDAADALRTLPANGRAELRALPTEHSAVLSKCMDLIEAFRRSSAPDQVAPQVQCRLRELLAPFAAHLVSQSRAAPAESNEKAVRCRAVARACTFIDEHLREPITLDDLCKFAGVRARALEYGFRQFYDVGPMAYLRSVRLCRVRRDLLQARRLSACVAITARRWSFTHMGQFSRDYRLLFGESPSATLARRRERLPQAKDVAAVRRTSDSCPRPSSGAPEQSATMVDAKS